MTKPAGQEGEKTPVRPAAAAGDDPFGLAPWLKEMPEVRIHPLMAHPAAAMMATAAIGFGFAGQIAGMMVGAMQGAAARTKMALDETAERPPRKAAARTAAPGAGKKPARGKVAKAAKADDLKAISGIGPKLEQVLNGMGYARYADIAAMTAADVERMDAELGLDGRIARDGWVEQAGKLAKGRGRDPAGTGEKEQRPKRRAGPGAEAGENGAGKTRGTRQKRD